MKEGAALGIWMICPRTTLLNIYQSLILPHLTYGLAAWGQKTSKSHSWYAGRFLLEFGSYLNYRVDPKFSRSFCKKGLRSCISFTKQTNIIFFESLDFSKQACTCIILKKVSKNLSENFRENVFASSVPMYSI